jgi:uncharacterized protein (DUF924 family)
MWFGKNDRIDEIVRKTFLPDLERAAQGDYDDWKTDARGRLALILLFDQFPRMIHRETPEAFAYDQAAQNLALEGMSEHADQALNPFERLFYYMPLEHAENLELQRKSVDLFRRLVDDSAPELAQTFSGYLDYAVRHLEVIERFGRFPHRNAILGRVSTPEEILFLSQPGAGF